MYKVFSSLSVQESPTHNVCHSFKICSVAYPPSSQLGGHVCLCNCISQTSFFPALLTTVVVTSRGVGSDVCNATFFFSIYSYIKYSLIFIGNLLPLLLEQHLRHFVLCSFSLQVTRMSLLQPPRMSLHLLYTFCNLSKSFQIEHTRISIWVF